MGKPLVEIKNLSVTFPGTKQAVPAIKEISFTIEAGRIAAIVGESGSGKSVTALSLLQLLPPSAKITGSAIIDYKDQKIDLLKAPKNLIRQIRGNYVSMIFQEPMTSLNPAYTCGNQVAEVLIIHQGLSKAAARAATLELFESVEITDPAATYRKFPHQLSGGQRQRVMIAMAISCNPKLLIADEPTTALDVTIQKKVLELLKNLQQKMGMSVLLITHDLSLVKDFADDIMVMFKGEIVEAGNATEVLQFPRHNYTKALMACKPGPANKGFILPTVLDFNSRNEFSNKHVENASVDYTKKYLEVKELEVRYPVKKNLLGRTTKTFAAVDKVSFNIYKNEILGLVGESGCGKTTIGRAILKLVPAAAGKILLNGKDLFSLKEKEINTIRREIQIVFQDPYGSLNPRLTVGEAIAEPMRVHQNLKQSQARDKTISLLEDVGLISDQFNRYPHQFSGGQRQRICIARALALDPSFLVFDESVSALDVSVQAQVLNLINELKVKHNFTALFISHDLSVVYYLCDRILVMRNGRIEEEGLPDQIFFKPASPYTKLLIDSMPGNLHEN